MIDLGKYLSWIRDNWESIVRLWDLFKEIFGQIGGQELALTPAAAIKMCQANALAEQLADSFPHDDRSIAALEKLIERAGDGDANALGVGTTFIVPRIPENEGAEVQGLMVAKETVESALKDVEGVDQTAFNWAEMVRFILPIVVDIIRRRRGGGQG